MRNLPEQLWNLRRRLRLRERSIGAFRNSRSRLVRGAVIKRYRDSHPIVKVQIGCGKNKLPGWLNTDLSASDDVVYLNAIKPLPFASNSVDYVFSEHMFEHISYENGNRLLHELGRVLKNGGRLRIATPDLAFLIRLHQEAESDLMKRYIRNSVDVHLFEPKLYEGSVVINNFFSSWGHRFIYDFSTLSHTLHSAGFVDVTRCRSQESSDPNFRGLESHGQVIGEEFNLLESMVVEASKP